MRNNYREQTVPNFVLRKTVLILMRIAEGVIHMYAIDAHHHHSHQSKLKVYTSNKESWLFSAKVAI